MPGYLSSLFDGGDTQADSSNHHLAAHGGDDVDETVGVHQEAGGSFEDANGTTHSFASSHDVSATVSAHVLVEAVVDTADGIGSDG